MATVTVDLKVWFEAVELLKNYRKIVIEGEQVMSSSFISGVIDKMEGRS